MSVQSAAGTEHDRAGPFESSLRCRASSCAVSSHTCKGTCCEDELAHGHSWELVGSAGPGHDCLAPYLTSAGSGKAPDQKSLLSYTMCWSQTHAEVQKVCRL